MQSSKDASGNTDKFFLGSIGHIETTTCPSLEDEKTYADTTKEVYRLRPVKTTEIIGRGMCFPIVFSLIEVDSEGRKAGNTFSIPRSRRTNR